MVEIFAIESTSSVLEVRVVLVEILRKKDTLKLESDNHCVDLSSTNCAPPQGSDSAIVGKDMDGAIVCPNGSSSPLSSHQIVSQHRRRIIVLSDLCIVVLVVSRALQSRTKWSNDGDINPLHCPSYTFMTSTSQPARRRGGEHVEMEGGDD
ncbi:hypothetical protein GYH30_042769 [Glycine max]|nr:hypothetical protein GYH30_042769 [Glycine max]